MYARTPTGLAPEIVHFTVHNGDNDFPKQHAHDVGGGDFIIKPQVSRYIFTVLILHMPLCPGLCVSSCQKDTAQQGYLP